MPTSRTRIDLTDRRGEKKKRAGKDRGKKQWGLGLRNNHRNRRIYCAKEETVAAERKGETSCVILGCLKAAQI